MPIYEYQCQACGANHDALQKISDTPLTECPFCGQLELKKMISAAGFRLTGGGWYETDFKTGGKKKNLLENSALSEPSKPADAKPEATAKPADTKSVSSKTDSAS